MKRIYKYLIPRESPFILELPKGAKILDVQFQGFVAQRGPPGSKGRQIDEIVMWALVDPDAKVVTRHFLSVTTGWELEDEHEDYHRYIKTVQRPDGLVLHIYEYEMENER